MRTFTSFIYMLLAVICLIAPLTHADKVSYGAPVNNDNNDDNNNEEDNTEDNDTDDNADADTDMAAATPVSVLNTVAVDIHFISGDVNNQFVVYHYCSALPSGLIQCAVYDGNEANSRLLGTEEIIGADAFQALPDVEKHLWHSHSYAILHGLFVIPGLAADKENGVLQTIIDTYGKVTDIYDRNNDLPTGVPRLAFGLVKDGQVNARAAAQLDAIANDGLTYQQRAANRKSLTAKAVINGANNYLSTKRGIQYQKRVFPVNSNGNATN